MSNKKWEKVLAEIINYFISTKLYFLLYISISSIRWHISSSVHKYVSLPIKYQHYPLNLREPS